MVEESEIDFEGFDIDAVSRYLGEYLTEQGLIFNFSVGGGMVPPP